MVSTLTDTGSATQVTTNILATFALVTEVAQVNVGGLLDKLDRARRLAALFVIAVGGVFTLSSTALVPMLFKSATLMGVGSVAEFGRLRYRISKYFGLNITG